MTIRNLLIASAVGLCCVASPAMAEPPLGSRLGKDTRADPVKQERDAALGAHEMARCVVNRMRGSVGQYLTSIDAKDSKRLSRKMSGELDCFSMSEGNDLVTGRMVMFPHDIYRGMLAEWMIRTDERRFTMINPLPRKATYARPWYSVSGRDSSVDEMATCASESAPAETLALLKTLPYSDAEGAAFGAVAPHLGACLRAGVKVTGNRQSLRAALADALYQRVANPMPIAAAGQPSVPQ
jgi:hypothetical protein